MAEIILGRTAGGGHEYLTFPRDRPGHSRGYLAQVAWESTPERPRVWVGDAFCLDHDEARELALRLLAWAEFGSLALPEGDAP